MSTSTMLMFGFLLLFLNGIEGETCNECKVNLTQPLEHGAPNCNRTVTNCSDDTICSQVLQIKNATVEYQELCLGSHFCANTSAVPTCPKESCYISCCHDDLCNRYNKSEISSYIPDAVMNFNFNMPKSSEKPKSSETPKSSSKPMTTEILMSTPIPTCHKDGLFLSRALFLIMVAWLALNTMM